MNNILKTTIYLFIGFFIGLLFNLDIPEQQNISETKFYDNMIINVDTIEIYDTSEITEDIINNRNGKIIVEKVVGKVVNCNLDGEILNCDNNQNYICYKSVDGAKQGDKVLTYFIYNPFTNVCDDVVIRLDFIIDNNII